MENEILPQCWEQISHKHVERRLLVAESCIALAPYVSVSKDMMKPRVFDTSPHQSIGSYSQCHVT